MIFYACNFFLKYDNQEKKGIHKKIHKYMNKSTYIYITLIYKRSKYKK